MNIITNRLQIPIARSIHDQRLVTTAEQVTKELVPTIESIGISAEEPLHADDQIRLRRFDHQVKMVGHENEGMHLPTRFGTTLIQAAEKQLAILISLEDLLPPIPAINDMINRPGILDSQLASHGVTLPSNRVLSI